MIECVLSWSMLIIGFMERDPLWFIASALFSGAAYLNEMREMR